MARVDIGADFSDVPAGRFPADGAFSGETFRQRCLVPPLRAGDHLVVNLDNTEGYGSSFLEEAFGGLIRVEGFTKQDLSSRLEIEANTARTQRYKRLILMYIENARASA